jgi:hypothetical protein
MRAPVALSRFIFFA